VIEKGFKESYDALAQSIIEGKEFPIALNDLMQFKKMFKIQEK
jgi:hypothetical protein